ncbi:MAG: hypothetical protein WB579_08555 [Bryobacteraceae bacterium]
MRLSSLSRSDSVAIAAIALACGLAAFVGMPALRVFEHDIFFTLDNAYRVSQGQIPHRDFASAWGPLFFLIQAAGLTISGMRPAGLGYATALFGAAVALWTYLAARTRMAAALACALGIYAVLLITAPFPLGFNPLAFSYAMAYNRYGYALLGIILVECGLQAFEAPAGKRPVAGRAFSIGAAWALLAFLKVTYAMVAVPFLLLWLWWRANRGRRFAALCGGFGVVAAMLLCYLRFDLADMSRDLVAAASGRGLTWKPWSILSPAFAIESTPLLLLAVAVSMGKSKASSDALGQARLWLYVLVTAGVSGFLLSTNHQSSALPLDGFAAVVLVDAAFAQRSAGAEAARPRRLLAVFLGALCFLPLTTMNAVSLVAASWDRYRGPEGAVVRLNAERGAGMIFGPVESSMTSESGGPPYLEALNDGLELIRARTAAGAGVLTIDMFNPFNYLLGRPSPRGGMAAAAYNYAFSDAEHPSAERFFGNAQYVLVRKYSRAAADFPIEDYHIQGLLRTYGPALEERFRPVAETGHWVLWRRK